MAAAVVNITIIGLTRILTLGCNSLTLPQAETWKAEAINKFGRSIPGTMSSRQFTLPNGSSVTLLRVVFEVSPGMLSTLVAFVDIIIEHTQCAFWAVVILTSASPTHFISWQVVTCS